MGRIETLAERYRSHIALPWRRDLAGPERAIFVVYDKTDERRLRLRLPLFEAITREAGHAWLKSDLTQAFAQWMAQLEYRDSYFEVPEDMELQLESGFLQYLTSRLRDVLRAPEADEDAVVAVYGVASLFGLVRLSALLREVEADVRGRILVFFPGEHENNNYRLLDARDGWNYLAVPITVHEDRGVYEA